jgi:hypothetical protein
VWGTPIEQKRLAIWGAQSDATDSVTRTIVCIDTTETKPVGTGKGGSFLPV